MVGLVGPHWVTLGDFAKLAPTLDLNVHGVTSDEHDWVDDGNPSHVLADPMAEAAGVSLRRVPRPMRPWFLAVDEKQDKNPFKKFIGKTPWGPSPI